MQRVPRCGATLLPWYDHEGQFAAVLVGAPAIRAVGTTRTEALAALQADLAQRRARGEFVSLELASTGVSGLAGKYRTDPTLREICSETYCMRDAEPQA
jgi:hypothetical protein